MYATRWLPRVFSILFSSLAFGGQSFSSSTRSLKTRLRQRRDPLFPLSHSPWIFLSLPSLYYYILRAAGVCCKLFKKLPAQKRKINYGDNPISLVRTAAKLPHSLVICFVRVRRRRLLCCHIVNASAVAAAPQNKRHHFPLRVFLLSRNKSRWWWRRPASHPRPA
jgi:hypothetical protein